MFIKNNFSFIKVIVVFLNVTKQRKVKYFIIVHSMHCELINKHSQYQ